MKLTRVESPENYRTSEWDPENLTDYEVRRIEDLNVDEAWYWYSAGCYAGAGQILMRRGQHWDVCDLGHCSCYGPTEDISFTEGSTFKEMWIRCSGGYQNELRILFEAARPELMEELDHE